MAGAVDCEETFGRVIARLLLSPVIPVVEDRDRRRELMNVAEPNDACWNHFRLLLSPVGIHRLFEGIASCGRMTLSGKIDARLLLSIVGSRVLLNMSGWSDCRAACQVCEICRWRMMRIMRSSAVVGFESSSKTMISLCTTAT
jgi:hypothetical protein